MDRRAWRVTVHRVTQTQTRLKGLSTLTPPSLSHISGQSPGVTIRVQLRKALESALTVTPLPLPSRPLPSSPLHFQGGPESMPLSLKAQE